jgi:Domain of unknown function (DUF4395)
MSLTRWMDDNLTTQGYCLGPEERRRLAVGLRFSTALCLGLVATGLVLESAPLLFALAGIGVVAGFTSRHPFDLLWNHAVRHAFRAPELPPNPTPRRHAFKIATVWLATVAALFAAGLSTVALVLGGAMLVACGAVTAFNLCIPSMALAIWERRRHREAMAV